MKCAFPDPTKINKLPPWPQQLKADWRVIKADSDQRISRAAEAIRSACPLPVLESEIEQIIEASELLGSLIDDDPKPERIMQYWKLATKLEERAKEFVDSVKGVAEDGFEDHVLEEQFME